MRSARRGPAEAPRIAVSFEAMCRRRPRGHDIAAPLDRTPLTVSEQHRQQAALKHNGDGS